MGVSDFVNSETQALLRDGHLGHHVTTQFGL